jgi:hypothetical protein
MMGLEPTTFCMARQERQPSARDSTCQTAQDPARPVSPTPQTATNRRRKLTKTLT